MATGTYVYVSLTLTVLLTLLLSPCPFTSNIDVFIGYLLDETNSGRLHIIFGYLSGVTKLELFLWTGYAALLAIICKPNS